MASSTETFYTNVGTVVTKVSPEENIWSSTTSIKECCDPETKQGFMKLELDLHLKAAVTLSLRSATGPETHVSFENCSSVDRVVKTFVNDKGDLLQVEVKLQYDHDSVFVKLLNGQRCQVPVDLQEDTVADLKTKIQKMLVVPPNTYLLSFGNFELAPDNRRLSDFEILRGSEIKLQEPLLAAYVTPRDTMTKSDEMVVFSAGTKGSSSGTLSTSSGPSASTSLDTSSKAPPEKRPRTTISPQEDQDGAAATDVMDSAPQVQASASGRPPRSRKSSPQQACEFCRSAGGSSCGAATNRKRSPRSPGPVYCFCRKKPNNQFMILCTSCDEWYHGRCVNLTEAEYDILVRNNPDYQWACPACVKMAQRYPEDFDVPQ